MSRVPCGLTELCENGRTFEAPINEVKRCVRRQVRVTPYQYDNVAWIIENSAEEICGVSSDYPHNEDGRDPIASF